MSVDVHDLLRLQAEAGLLDSTADDTRVRFGKGRIEALRSAVSDGCAELSRRLEALGGHPPAVEAAAPAVPPGAAPEPEAPLKAYGPCFERLGRALREARRVSDVKTMAVLRRLIVCLEKHLWLFNLPLQERRIQDWSAVNLFSLC